MRFLSTYAAVASAALTLGLTAAASAEEAGTLYLINGFSFVSFGDEEMFSIPAGSLLRFQWGTPNPDGSVPFTLHPNGVVIHPIPMEPYKELRYTLTAPATGTMQVTPEGRQIDFTAQVRATLVNHDGQTSTADYTVPFTTETATARDLAGDLELEVSGMRLVDGAWVVQLVGGVTNHAQAFPEPGTAVYTVLTGTFDSVP